jgi:hypothetical protein
MSNAGVSSWKTLIKDLQQLLDAADPASRAAANKAIYARLNDSAVSQQLPHAAWKKLVKDVQVSWACIE